MSRELLQISPQELVRLLRSQGISRFHLVYDAASGAMSASHPQLQPLADFVVGDKRDFTEHEGAFFQVSRMYETLQGAFVHRTRRGAAAGGVRYWTYDTVEDYLRDGLRLAVGMTMKNALAGLWWGGGKGVMARNPEVERDDPEARASLYREYGEFMTRLKGCYVTAEDVGTSVEDMAQIFSKTRFTTCIPPALGGSGNPSVPTARGVIAGMEAALEFRGESTLEGKTVAVQGMGHVGEPLIGYLLDKGVAKVIGSDIDAELIGRVKQVFAGKNLEARLVEHDDVSILGTECDIVSPCATGATLNPRSIPTIKARIVCGAANNQLEDGERDDEALEDRRITYVPDFLTNRMGIVTCADEGAGYVTNDPMIERHLTRDWEYSIYNLTLKVLETSRSTGQPPGKVALEMANALSLEINPIYGHRGQQIIDSLVADRWYEV
ncbi:MAG: Glu/Leu/Phe/Val dehydrogenase [Gemmatimonadota bacterium]|nr:MAG: Glu/Leu/Phe/Val dehydrogenase [Gemmatimonadota bacterium]